VATATARIVPGRHVIVSARVGGGYPGSVGGGGAAAQAAANCPEYNRAMRSVKPLALLLAVYLAADFVDASAPGILMFDSALFLGTVVQSKMPSGDTVDHRSIPAPLPMKSSPAPSPQTPIPVVRQTSVPVEMQGRRPRDATRRSTPPSGSEDQ
jgi:hypothetical protein